MTTQNLEKEKKGPDYENLATVLDLASKISGLVNDGVLPAEKPVEVLQALIEKCPVEKSTVFGLGKTDISGPLRGVINMVANGASSSDEIIRVLQELAGEPKQAVIVPEVSDDEVVGTWGDRVFTKKDMAQTVTIMLSDGSKQVLVPHCNGGGLVPLVQDESNLAMPFVAKSVFVGPRAMVFGQNPRVTGDVRLCEGATVQDSAQVSGQVIIRHSAIVRDNAIIDGEVIVGDCAVVGGHSQIRGIVLVCGHAVVDESAEIDGSAVKILDNSCVTGQAKIADEVTVRRNAVVGGNMVICGNTIISTNTKLTGDKTIHKDGKIITDKTI
jgi:carbonic anhydrase/acetyltransferase-like protein (isoleucine patch superfamily)